MLLFNVINNLIVDIIVGLILALLKAIARIEDVALGENKPPSKNIFLDHNYSYWEQTILWLEDITESKFSYLSSQVRFITGLIGISYGCVIAIILLLFDMFFGFIIHPFSIFLISLISGIILGYLGGKSLIDRPEIFDRSPNEFKGEHFDR